MVSLEKLEKPFFENAFHPKNGRFWPKKNFLVIHPKIFSIPYFADFHLISFLIGEFCIFKCTTWGKNENFHFFHTRNCPTKKPMPDSCSALPIVTTTVALIYTSEIFLSNFLMAIP